MNEFPPHGVGVGHHPSVDMCVNPEALRIPYAGVLQRLLHTDTIDHKLHFQPFSLLKRMGSGAENSKLPIMSWSFQLPAHIQEPIRSCLIRKKDTHTTQEIIRFQELCAGVDTSICFQRSHKSQHDFPVSLWFICLVSLPELS